MSLRVWQLDPAQLTPYYNLALCSALVQQGCEVRYITSRYLYENISLPDSFITDYAYFRSLEHTWLLRVPFLRKILRAFSYPFDHSRLLSEVKRDCPDIVHIQWSRLPALDQHLIRQIRALGIPVVHTVHDVIPLFASDSTSRALNRVYLSVDALILHAEANRQLFIRTYPDVPEERLHIVPMIMMENAIVPAGGNQEEARTKLGLPQGVPIALFFGAIKSYKGVDILWEAYKLAVKQCPDLYLMIVGRPDEETFDLMEEIQRDNLPNVIVRLDYVPTEEIWQCHLAADVIVFPYRHIYQSAALATSMAFGRAVIVTDVGGLPEMIDGNGWIVLSEEPVALSEILLEAVSDKARLQRMGQRSREMIEQTGGSQKVAQMTISLYSALIKSMKGSPSR
jgi:glycosyltransferase involved in cell wall biosynthesis